MNDQNAQYISLRNTEQKSTLSTGGFGVEIAGVDGEICPGGGQLDPLRRLT